MAKADREMVIRLTEGAISGDRAAAADLLPLLYEELRALARQHVAREQPGHTLQATALVHEAYLRLVGTEDPGWDGRSHFFAAAASAMRRILVDHARNKKRLKRGGHRAREDRLPDDVAITVQTTLDLQGIDLLELDVALNELAVAEGNRKCDVVSMRVFAGMTIDQIANALGVTTRTIDRDWRFSRAWLFRRIQSKKEKGIANE